jgi:hypothetical protein
MPIAAQEAPRVIFCTGQCTAVDDKGVRTPAPKGTQLRENQRLETGPGAYAQLKMGHDVALGLGERAQVRFDQKSVRGGDVVILEQGRIRMLDGVTIGKPVNRTLELRTTDGRFALRGADIEVKAPPRGTSGGASLTFVKLNVGDAQLLSPQGAIAITKDVQAFTAGKVATDKAVSLTDVAMTPTRPSTTATAVAIEPVKNLPAATPVLAITPAPVAIAPLGSPLKTGLTPIVNIAPITPVVPAADLLLASPVTPSTPGAAPISLKNALIAPPPPPPAPGAPIPVKQTFTTTPGLPVVICIKTPC